MADSQRKTANLAHDISITYATEAYSNALLFDADLKPNTTYTLSFVSVSGLRFYTNENLFTSEVIFTTVDGLNTITITTVSEINKSQTAQAQNGLWRILKNRTSLSITPVFDNVMLNTGSTAKPYEPYSSTGWLHSLRKLTTATEAVENPLYSDGTAITSYTIKGNTVQNGTPTPSNPVEVQGVGERTENLFDGNLINAILNDTTGEAVPNDNWRCTDYMGVNDSTVTVGWESSSNFYQAKVASYDSSKAFISLETMQNYAYSNTFTLPNGTKYIRVSFSVKVSGGDVIRTNIMINNGTVKPFEPYGYKIPISSGGVTTNIYLGSTQTTRQIGKLILTGEENWGAHATIGNWYYVDNIFSPIVNVGAYCDRYNFTSYSSAVGLTNGQFTFGNPGGVVSMNRLIFKDTAQATVTDFKTYLQQQYANGTPVTVWYVLQTAETATVNEPLMKIGDYADTLSNAASIPTTEGANSITVDTTVQPSEFTATWTGWHDASVKEWDGSDWQ